jgi:hypothetical protein
VHAIVTDGVFFADGAFCSLPPPDYQQLLPLFRHNRGGFQTRPYIISTVEILDHFRHPGFSAFQGPAI